MYKKAKIVKSSIKFGFILCLFVLCISVINFVTYLYIKEELIVLKTKVALLEKTRCKIKYHRVDNYARLKRELHFGHEMHSEMARSTTKALRKPDIIGRKVAKECYQNMLNEIAVKANQSPFVNVSHPVGLPKNSESIDRILTKTRHHQTNRKVRRKKLTVENISEMKNCETHSIIIAHFEGDSSNQSIDSQKNYLGNGILRNSETVYKFWKATVWSDTEHVQLYNGVFRVLVEGLYFIYAQVHYVDRHDTNGYRIYVNDEPVAQCTCSGPVNRRTDPASNTCFTGSITSLNRMDRIILADLEPFRYSKIKSTHTFLGIIKLSSTRK